MMEIFSVLTTPQFHGQIRLSEFQNRTAKRDTLHCTQITLQQTPKLLRSLLGLSSRPVFINMHLGWPTICPSLPGTSPGLGAFSAKTLRTVGLSVLKQGSPTQRGWCSSPTCISKFYHVLLSQSGCSDHGTMGSRLTHTAADSQVRTNSLLFKENREVPTK